MTVLLFRHVACSRFLPTSSQPFGFCALATENAFWEVSLKIKMKYFTGEEVRVGDKVQMDNNCFGVVVCSIDADEYSPEHPREQWSYLKVGVMFDTDWAGLVHYTEADEDLILLERASS